MSPVERSEAKMRTAMKSQKHLMAWLDASGRSYLVLKATDLVQALPFPEGIEPLMQIFQAYRDHRATQETGRYDTMPDPLGGPAHEVPVMKGETLEIEELDRAIRYLIGQASLLDPDWSLRNPPL